ncbi:MAG: ATP-binding cassette domain-containing protein [Candidatus Aminicenantes bacterium]|nr:MAG: ATP-binding cassette domain-containing protein [Candidatus Aminicenantes bacterium]
MKIKEIKLNNFKRFTDLTITNISDKARLVVIIGPNGSGKSALFDALHHWYRMKSQTGWLDDQLYYIKEKDESFDWNQSVQVSLYNVDSYQSELIKKSMYFRTAYRNDPDFNITSLGRMNLPYSSLKIHRFIDNDQTVSENYQRLISLTLAGVYNENNDDKKVKTLREELIGKIRSSMKNVFDDLNLNNIGDPLGDGAFYFEKSISKSFHYKNLAGGEKSAFDILLDIIIKLQYYPEAIYCIDEPEAHMHTELQGKLLEEIFNLIPEKGQLWITTHSLGMMRKAKELAQRNPSSVDFIDFHDIDFDSSCVLRPVSIDRVIWEKFISIAVGDISDLIKPQTIVLCEGDKQGRRYKNFDADCYSKIFAQKHPDVIFVSAGAATELEKDDNLAYTILKDVLANTQIFRLIDRDDKSDPEVNECRKKGIKVLSRRHLESYLFDEEILNKLTLDLNASPEQQAEILKVKNDKIQESISRGNPPDDIKSAAGNIYVEIKKILNLTQCGNTLDAFMRDTLVPLITEETNIFQKLEKDIFP